MASSSGEKDDLFRGSEFGEHLVELGGWGGIGVKVAEGILDAVEEVLEDLGIPVGGVIVSEIGVEDAALADFMNPGDGVVSVSLDRIAKLGGHSLSFEITLL